MAQFPLPVFTRGNVAFSGVFKVDAAGGKVFYLTQNMDPGVSVFDGDLTDSRYMNDGTWIHYRIMNPFRSRFAAAIQAGIKHIWVEPGSRVLYIGDDASMVTISYISDIVGSAGMVYVVGNNRQIETNSLLGQLGAKRSNVTCIAGVASSPVDYRETIGNRVNVIFYEDDTDNEITNLALNAQTFLANGGFFCTFIKADVTVTVPPTPHVFIFMAREQKLKENQFNIVHSITLSPVDEKCKCFVGYYGL